MSPLLLLVSCTKYRNIPGFENVFIVVLEFFCRLKDVKLSEMYKI